MEIVNAVVAGIAVGSSYALLGLGLSLIFSTTGVLSFAQAAFAMLASYVYAWGTVDQGWSPWAAGLVAVAAATAYGLVVEGLVVRRVVTASPATRMVATLAVLAVTQGVVLQVFGFAPKGAARLIPVGSVHLGALGVDYQQLLVVAVVAIVATGLAAFLRLTRMGLAVRASAQSRTGASLVGVDRLTVARLNWGIGSLLAGLAGVLIAPLTIVSIGTFPGLLLKALAGALLGGLGGLALAAVGGVLVGALESVASTVSNTPGIRELVVLALVVVLLLVRRSWPAELETSLDSAAAATRPAPLGIALVLGLSAFAALQALTDPFWAAVGAVALIYVLVSLSLVLLVGWAGQLSLMHGALVGVGAFGLTWFINRFGMPLPLAIVCAGLTGAGLAAFVSLTGLRLKGAQIVIVTLACAQACSEWLFQFRGTSWTIPRPQALADDRAFCAVVLAVTIACYCLLLVLRRSAWGRALSATARSETVAEHFGVNAHLVRLQAWALSGFIAATAGAFYALYLTAIQPSDFGALLSIALLLYVVSCGRASLLSPLLVGLVFVFGPEVARASQTSTSALPAIVSGLAVVVLLAVRPAGLADLLTRRRALPQARREIAPLGPVVRPLLRGLGDGRVLRRDQVRP